MSRTYQAIEPIERAEAEVLLTSGDASTISMTLLRMSWYEPDWRWVQATCQQFASHADGNVRACAAMALGYLANFNKTLDVEAAMPVLQALMADPDPDVAASATAAIYDIEWFMGDLALAQRAALAGAEVALRFFERVSQLPQELKADGTIVTEADRTVEQTVKDVLLAERPDDAFLGEETGESGSSNRRWILDGIDGTAVFVVGDDRWQTLIALEVDGQITVGVAILPAQGKIWWAERGRGAYVADFEGSYFFDERRLAVSTETPDLAGCRLGTVPPFPMLRERGRATLGPLAAVTPPREWSAHAALMVASGELDLAVQVGGSIWDYPPLALIVQEAGGTYSGSEGQGHPVTGTAIFASNAALHAAALAQLAHTR